MTTTLQKYIESLDPKTLPRVLQIQSGYYGGPLHELLESDSSLSAGEVIKVIGYKVKKVMTHIFTNDEYDELRPRVELPLNFPGLFKIVPNKNPYLSIEEIVNALYIGRTRFGLPGFYSHTDLCMDDITIQKGQIFFVKSVEEVQGISSVTCRVDIHGQESSFSLPLSYKGEFFEYQDEHMYTLKEILDWKITKNRGRMVVLMDLKQAWDITKIYPSDFKGVMILEPVYEVQAVLEFGKDVINILSDLDVEVKDITQNFDMKYFIQTVDTTLGIFERTSTEFPMIVEIIGGPLGKQPPTNLLRHGKKMIIHAKGQELRVIASELRSNNTKKYFLVPSSYKGKFKRRPRFFTTVYDLNIANRCMDDLCVVATKTSQSSHEQFSSVCVGDQLQVKHLQSCEVIFDAKTTIVDALVCAKMEDKCCVKVTLPLYMEGNFMEVVHDNRQYYISELCKHFQFPVTIKVSVRDLFTVGEDVLARTSLLQLEEQITDSYLLVSFLDSPKEVWELPVNRLNLSLQVISKFYGDTYSSPTRTYIEEINEQDYYMLRRYENQVQLPPPRPPKTPVSASFKSKKIMTPEIEILQNNETSS
ncbi:protein THEMIS [Spea bombifrons]|uniref:protein THEMIS n=1 Tax=Spea bombifrons TaxID=233779 RepID=UPI002349F392|nr:protein THEMIS [Spea bombifrons]